MNISQKQLNKAVEENIINKETSLKLWNFLQEQKGDEGYFNAINIIY